MARKRKRQFSVSSLEKRIAALERREKSLRSQLKKAKKRAATARKKSKKKAAKKRKAPTNDLQSRGRSIRQRPRLGLSRDYRSGFKPFLERVDKRVRGRFRTYAIVRVILLDYAGSPTRDLSIFLGSLTAKQAKEFTNRQILARAPGRWGTLGTDSEVLFIASLKGGKFGGVKPDKVRSKIAKRNPKARASIAAANIKRRRAGLPFHPSTR